MITLHAYIHWFYIITLSMSGLAFLYLRTLWKKFVPEIFFWIHFFIVMWSAMMYVNLAYNTPLAPYTYYADWIISTPLIMLALAFTAMYPLQSIQWSLIFPLIMSQVMVVVSGALAQASGIQQAQLVFFTYGNLMMLPIFYLFFGPLMHLASQSKVVYNKYQKLAYLFVIFWISYPLVWILGTPGYGILNPTITQFLFVLLPLLCKPVFGFIDLYYIKTMHE